MALMTELCLLSVLILLVSQGHGLPTEGTVDCSKYKNEHQSVRGVFRTMAGADIVVESESMTITKDDVDVKQVISVRLACLLKGQPGATQLNVRLVHNATRCFDSETLDIVITHNQNGAFVLALNRADNGIWNLMDGGLFEAKAFFKQFSQANCNVTAIYGGSCVDRSGGAGIAGCATYNPIVSSLTAIVAKKPFVQKQQPSPESPKQQQQKQQQQDQQETDMLASDQPAAKKLGDFDAVVSDKGNSAEKVGPDWPVKLQLIFFATVAAVGWTV